MKDLETQNNLTKLDFAEIARQRGGSPEQYLNMEDDKWELVKCPFCFKKFTPFRVHYRISGISFASVMNAELYGGRLFGNQNEELNEHVAQPDEYQTYDDDRLASFWKQYHWNIYKKKPPVITVMPELERKNLGTSEEPDWQDVPQPGFIQSWRVLVDRDGFPCGMEDPEKDVISYERLCPKCHNRLPFAYGKYPVKFIDVIGMRNSGKGFYLSSILDQFDVVIGYRTGLEPIAFNKEINDYIHEHRIYSNCSFIQPTSFRLCPHSLSVTVQRDNQLTTIVLFDISGENCVDADYMTKFDGFIRNADGIIMLIDPRQLADTFELPKDSEGWRFSPEYVLQTIYQLFLSDESELGKKCRIPLAVTFSKSDLLKTYFNNHSEFVDNSLIEEIRYSAYTAIQCVPGYLRGYAYEDGMEISMTLESILDPRNPEEGSEDGESLYKVVSNLFANHAFFAVAPLGTNITGGMFESAPMSIRIEQPLAWLFYKMGLIPAMHRANVIESKKAFWRKKAIPKKSSFDPGAIKTINGGLKSVPQK